MRPTDIDVDDDDDTGASWPVSSSSRPQQNFVPAASNRPEVPAQLWQPVTSGDMQVWQPGEAVREETSAVDRSIGLLIRQLPLSIVWIVLAVTAALCAWAVIPAWWALVFGLGLSLIHISEPTRPY